MSRRKRARRGPDLELGDLQLALMRVLWDRGEATVVEVQEALRPGRDLAPTTVATTLARLEKRGIVAHRREGRVYVYRPAVEKEDVRRSMVGALMDRLFRGDPAALVSHLLVEEDIDRKELEKLRALLERRRGRRKGR